MCVKFSSTSTMVAPDSCFSRRIAAYTASIATGARPRDGSSISSIRAGRIIPRPRPTSRRSPPDSVRAFCPRFSSTTGRSS